MKRTFFATLALIMMIGLQSQTARAADNTTYNNNWNAFWAWLSHGQDPRLTAAGIGLGIAGDVVSYELTSKHGFQHMHRLTSLAAYGATTVGCVVIYPFVGTIVLNRPLTPREAYTGIADCIVPFIGGWIVDAALPHDAWTDGLPPKAARRHH